MANSSNNNDSSRRSSSFMLLYSSKWTILQISILLCITFHHLILYTRYPQEQADRDALLFLPPHLMEVSTSYGNGHPSRRKGYSSSNSMMDSSSPHSSSYSMEFLPDDESEDGSIEFVPDDEEDERPKKSKAKKTEMSDELMMDHLVSIHKRRKRRREEDEFGISPEEISRVPKYYHPETMPIFKDFIGSPSSTILELGGPDCTCPMLSIDCLDTLACLPSSSTTTTSTPPSSSIAAAAATKNGPRIRNWIRRHATFWNDPIADVYGSPIGMATQYTTIGVFREWLSKNQIQSSLSNWDEQFLNETHYEYCVENGLQGRYCFIDDFYSIEDEDDDDDDDNNIDTKNSNIKEQEVLLKKQIDDFIRLQQRPLQASPLTYLLAYCQISRITFNLRPHVLKLYQNHLKATTTTLHDNDTTTTTTKSTFDVGLHVRRGDACRHETSGYSKRASKLNSPPQFSSQRNCYDTQVYVKALRRIQEMISSSPSSEKKKKKKQLVVHVATDHSASLLEEIKEVDPELFQSTTWKYLDYSRDVFDYMKDNKNDSGGFFIESPENKNKAILGESALLDVHHLSLGVDAFVGHLGSRFGKLGWYQAMARKNGFVPFYTVDGHAACCDIDENCGHLARDPKTHASAIVSMENCLGIFMAHMDDYQTNETLAAYWEKGSTHRIHVAEAEQQWRHDRINFVESKIANYEWTNLNVNVATWDYYRNNKKKKKYKRKGGRVVQVNASPVSVTKEEDFFTDTDQCHDFMNQEIPTTLPTTIRNHVNEDIDGSSCVGFDGILHIRHGDIGGASGAVFFQFMIGMLRWADQHNYKPWVHMNSISEKVYDPIVHGNSDITTEMTMLKGMEIGWARDPDDPLGYMFPGLPYKGKEGLKPHTFQFKGTGIWNHYFEPVSDFVPGDASCRNKPLVTMTYDHILPGLHSQAPWVPHPWRYWMPDHIQKPDIPMQTWLDEQRYTASEIVIPWIRPNHYLEQRARCAVLPSSPSQTSTSILGMHIRHGDKWPSRDRIPVSTFLPFAQAFLEKDPTGVIYIATDSSLVWKEIQSTWGDHNISLERILQQPSVQGLSSNDTATFDLKTVSRHRTNTEALTDIFALSKCNYLLHGHSAMTEAAFYLNPSLMRTSVDLENVKSSQERAEKLEFFQEILTKFHPTITRLRKKKNKDTISVK